MTPAITTTTWIATLSRIIRTTPDDMTRTLAQMLRDIAEVSDDPEVGAILDVYGTRLLGVRE